ncbi:MAG: ribosomal protein S18 acetylase RimI-like enzyme [Glaciecola sp.]|jgi:ribosomal protein S18 acetylase RimI-like enzyme
MNKIEIKSFNECDWEQYRHIRLKALADSPKAFGSTLVEELKLSPEDWKTRLHPLNGNSVLPLCAVKDDLHVGLAIGLIRRDDFKTGYIYQMWVSKNYRGNGVGKKLLERIIVWSQENDIEKLILDVEVGNAAPIGLYSSFGFVASQELIPLRDGSNLMTQQMILDII